MGFRDRFFTPTTAKAFLSWRFPVAVAIGIVAGVVGVPWVAATLIGLAAYGAMVAVAMPKGRGRSTIDAFTLSEPWRRFVQSAQRSRQALAQTVKGVADGPLKARLTDITERLEQAVEESWAVAKRGDEIDEAVNRIDPVRLRSQLTTLQGQSSGDVTEAVASVESQLASADRLKALSASTADRLRLTQARLDELVARAAEVSVGAKDTDTYAHDVDNLVIELEALRQAVAETEQTST